MAASPDLEEDIGEWPPLNEGYAYRNEIKGVGDGAGRQTILEFYCTRFSEYATAGDWHQRLALRQVTLNDQLVGLDEEPTASSDDAEVIDARRRVLEKKDVLVYRRTPWAEPEAPTAIRILYEDEDLLVIDKPSGLQVLPGGVFYQRTCLTLLQRYHLRARVGRWPSASQTSFPAPMHRLGRGTSGVLVCACTAKARKQLVAAFSKSSTSIDSVVGELRRHFLQRQAGGFPLLSLPRSDGTEQQEQEEEDVVEGGDEEYPTLSQCLFDYPSAAGHSLVKIYRALVTGLVEQDEGLVETPIGQITCKGLLGGIFAATPEGKPACSAWRVVHKDVENNQTIVDVRIWTGLSHQIRIHMASVGHPLVGDPLFVAGGRPLPTDDSLPPIRPSDLGYTLHSHQLVFDHPTAGSMTRLHITAPLPPSLRPPPSRTT